MKHLLRIRVDDATMRRLRAKLREFQRVDCGATMSTVLRHVITRGVAK